MATKGNMKADENAAIESDEEVEEKKEAKVQKRKKSSKKAASGSDDEGNEKDTKAGAKVAKKKSGGLNYAAICILVMMVGPALVTLGIHAYDIMYPKAAAARTIRDKIQRCYSAAKPKEVVDIEKIMKKYDGRETALFANLRNKYSKFPECHVG